MKAKIIIIVLLSLSYNQGFAQVKNKKSLPPKPPTDKMVNDCNCYKIKNIITTKRLQNYPFNQAQTIMVIAFDSYFRLDSNYGSTSRTLIQNDSLVKKNLKQIITLDSTQINQLINILFNYGEGKHCYANARTVQGCYFPRHAIVFLDSNNRVIDFFEICFECNSYVTKDKLLENSLSKCNNQLSLIKKYFEQIGITHWKDTESHNLILEKKNNRLIRNQTKKMNIRISYLLIAFCLVGCNNSNKQIQKIFPDFVIPYIIQTTNDDSSKFENEHSSYVYTPFGGKFKFIDTIDLKGRNDSNFYKDRIRDFYTANSKIADTLPTNGFEMEVDYKTSIKIEDKYKNLEKGKYFYPAFIINRTPSAKVLIGKDDHLFAMQEAKDSNEIWRPIELEGYGVCGCCYWAVNVHHNEYVVMLLPKYKGNFKTKLRVRLRNNATIYASKPFDGMIDYKQLLKK